MEIESSMTRRIRRRQPPRSPRVTTTFRGNCRVKHTRQNAIPANKPLIRKPTQAGDGASVRRHSSFVIRHSSSVSCREDGTETPTDRTETGREAKCCYLGACVALGGGARGETLLSGRVLSGGEQDYSGCRRQRIGRVARVLACFIRSCLPSVVVFLVLVVLSRRVTSATRVFCLNNTVCCAMLSPSDNSQL